jgi:GxxExxY protein
MQRTTTSKPGILADRAARIVVDAALAVHRALGPGLLESVYEDCLAHELALRDVPVKRQVALPIVYRGLRIEPGLRMDMLVDDIVVVEVKAVEALSSLHEAQLLTYLKLSARPLGLLINFNVTLLKHGLRRLVLTP